MGRAASLPLSSPPGQNPHLHTEHTVRQPGSQLPSQMCHTPRVPGGQGALTSPYRRVEPAHLPGRGWAVPADPGGGRLLPRPVHVLQPFHLTHLHVKRTAKGSPFSSHDGPPVPGWRQPPGAGEPELALQVDRCCDAPLPEEGRTGLALPREGAGRR
uniref:Uncharacterized protein n=1 Tax=Myotis myotis TaxID=51298 RepID=A0A7J7RRR5_MYOMY|nr:hypothetical protein mMyoMyo1_010223 [Myotis myotis]